MYAREYPRSTRAVRTGDDKNPPFAHYKIANYRSMERKIEDGVEFMKFRALCNTPTTVVNIISLLY